MPDFIAGVKEVQESNKHFIKIYIGIIFYILLNYIL